MSVLHADQVEDIPLAIQDAVARVYELGLAEARRAFNVEAHNKAKAEHGEDGVYPIDDLIKINGAAMLAQMVFGQVVRDLEGDAAKHAFGLMMSALAQANGAVLAMAYSCCTDHMLQDLGMLAQSTLDNAASTAEVLRSQGRHSTKH